MFLIQVDGCKNYSVLSEADRTQGNALSDYSYCTYDKRLVTGWYRFQGAAGDRMQDKCVPMRRCGNKCPGWLESIQPTVAEGVVTRKVCFSGTQGCCAWCIVKVKNCSDYYVHELQRMPYLDYRYCSNTGACKFHSFFKLTYLVQRPTGLRVAFYADRRFWGSLPKRSQGNSFRANRRRLIM